MDQVSVGQQLSGGQKMCIKKPARWPGLGSIVLAMLVAARPSGFALPLALAMRLLQPFLLNKAQGEYAHKCFEASYGIHPTIG